MERYFVDSNIFLRYYSKDDEVQSAAAEAFFLRAKRGEIELFCGPPVFFETGWVLKTFYKLPDSYILDILESMLSIPNLTVFDVEYVTSAISIARQNSIGFADSYIAAVALDKNIGVSSFNTKHFKKVGVALYSFS
ncbi:MAG: PIN domain-containing protein [Synergistaceae bacterium]|jgi:predicted nucleic-acid-binding protein|nr:PIN domain-containing protein [Synergistaceae bacterium]